MRLKHVNDSLNRIAISDKWMWILLILCFSVFANSVLFRGHYATPHTNSLELGLKPDRYSRALSDIDRFFLPELKQHLESMKEGKWIGLWDPYTQGGKPASLSGGYSPVYPVTWLLAQFTDNPYLLHTWIAIVTVGLSALFSYLAIRETGALPVAAATATVLIAFGLHNALWFGFSQFVAWIVWTMAMIWFSLRLLRKGDFLSSVGFAFAVYCALISARHQVLIQQVYFLLPFGLYWSLLLLPDMRTRLWRYAGLAGALVAGIAASLPFLLALSHVAENSVRLHADAIDFLASGLTGGPSGKMLARLMVVLSAPHKVLFVKGWIPAFGGCSLLPLGMLGVIIAIRFLWRNPLVWISVGVAFFFLLMAVWPDLHRFAIGYMGFSLSRAQPVEGALIPLILLAAWGIDAAWRQEQSKHRTVNIYGIAAGCIAFTWVAVLFVDKVPHWWAMMLGVTALYGASALALQKKSVPVLACVLLAGIVLFSLPKFPSVPADKVLHDSPVLATIHETLAPGQRMARFGENHMVLHSNKEAMYELRSIHNYDSLASKDYVNLTEQISDAGSIIMGRHFRVLDNVEKLQSPLLAKLAVQVILSDRPLHVQGWQEKQITDTFWLLFREPLPLAWLGEYDRHPASSVGYRQISMEEMLVTLPSPHAEGILTISQQYHQGWRAEDQNAQPLKVMKAQDFFLAVAIHADTTEVRLRYHSIAFWAWVPMVAFAAMFVIAGLMAWRKCRKLSVKHQV